MERTFPVFVCPGWSLSCFPDFLGGRNGGGGGSSISFFFNFNAAGNVVQQRQRH